MSNYQEQYAAAEKAGKAESLNIIIQRWTEAGQTVVGKVVLIEDMRVSKFKNAVKRYLMRTDNGLVSCVLGAAADAGFASMFRIGQLVAITYRGKQQLEGGRSMNVFNVSTWGGEPVNGSPDAAS